MDSHTNIQPEPPVASSANPVNQPQAVCTQALHYETLPADGQWIRLLELAPGAGDEPLRCQLRPAQLKEGLHFDAVSYVWGRDKTAFSLDCSSGVVKVPANLEDALRRLRDGTTTRLLWADAVCIDQQNVQERGQQVALMGLIFWAAAHVHVWVGHDHLEQAELAFATMRQFIQAAMTHAIEFGFDPDRFGLPGVPVDEVAKIDPLAWEAIGDFLNLPWFSRVWVQQELGLSADATFYWGDDAINATYMVRFMATFLKLRPMLKREVPALRREAGIAARRFQKMKFVRCFMIFQRISRPTYSGHEALQQATGTNFLNILLLRRDLEASDRRDYVYGFLGHPSARWQNAYSPTLYPNYRDMCASNLKPLVQPDYSKSLQTVYIDAALALLQQCNDLSVLCAVSHVDGEPSDVPSWVPQWHLGENQHCIGADPKMYYNASGGRPWIEFPAYDAGSHELRVSGIVVDTAVKIRRASRMPRFTSLVSSQSSSDRGKRTEDRRSRPWDVVYDDPVLAYFLTVAAGLLDRHPAEDNMEMFRHDLEAHVLLKRPSYTADGTLECRSSSHALGQPTRLTKAFDRATSGRELFRTERGYMGIGPDTMRKGDKIVVLLGGKVPFILREQGKTGKYQLVGECYVHGLMRGEGFAPLEDTQSPSRECRDIILV